MAAIIRLRDHARASIGSRAARAVRTSAVIPAEMTGSVTRITDHHSAGTLSRCHHLETADALAPISAAIDSREGHSSITDRKDRISSVMPKNMGQMVPKVKDYLSHDENGRIGHNVRMPDHIEKIAETAWRDGFRARLKSARGNRSQAVMAGLLGLTQTTYSKYEGQRASAMPIRLLPLFSKICGVDLEWLIEGDKSEKSKSLPKADQPQPVSRRHVRGIAGR